MSGFSGLFDISRALQFQIVSALTSAPDAGFGADDSNVLLRPPSDGLAATVRAVIYLSHIGIDPHSRNQPRLTEPGNPAQFVRPPLPLHLRYLFVPRTEDEMANQLMPGRILQHFHDAPTVRPVPGSAMAARRPWASRPTTASFRARSPCAPGRAKRTRSRFRARAR